MVPWYHHTDPLTPHPESEAPCRGRGGVCDLATEVGRVHALVHSIIVNSPND